MSSSNSFKVYLSSNEIENLQIIFLTTKLNLNITLGEKQINNVPCYPVVEVNNNNNNNNKLIFGSNNISRYFINNYDSLFEDLLDIEEFQIRTNNKTLLNQKIAWNGIIYSTLIMIIMIMMIIIFHFNMMIASNSRRSS